LRAQAETALKERERQLLQAQKMEAVGRLAGGLAHDINNYLAAIRGQCELVKMKAGEGDTAARRMDMVLATTDRASSLIERLLTFSRPQPVMARRVHLNQVVRDLEPMMERLIGGDIELTTRLCPRECAVQIDPAQVEQVIVNLLINAREAMPSGGRLTLTTDCRHFGEDDPKRPPTMQPGSYVEVAVEDSGVGIPAAIRHKIFEPFFTTKEEASGLGLPTVYGIVKQNGGAMDVESRSGAGTTFRIYLPRQTAEGPVEVPSKEIAQAPAGRGERLLVVDDHDEFRESLDGLLQGLGYQVTVAPDASAAAEHWAEAQGSDHPFDLLITDVVMPGGDGRQLVDHLRRHHGPLRALFVSGYTGDVALRHGVKEEAVELLRKPFSVEVLGRKVRKLLDRPPEPEAGSDPEPRRAAAG
jgi:nitrogen-specific signal transduction histidine kinase/ActR/RegA family two-component response regulator